MSNSFIAENVSKSYNGKNIVENISIKVNTGEIKGILGPNGAGKTTTFHILAGLTTTDSGKVTLNNQDITNYRLPKRAKLGLAYLPQDASIFRGLTVSDNIYGVLELLRVSKAEKQQRLEDIFEKFQLHKIRNTLGSLISGGERRRVEIARALALEPKFILLDEPFAGIDPVSITELTQIIRQITKEENAVGVIITDHNVREALRICDEADIMHQGKIIISGSANEILQNKKVREIYLGEDFEI